MPFLTSMSTTTSSSSVSQHSAMRSKLLALGLGSKPQISLHLDQSRNTFSTLDKISGKVVITTSSNTRFDKINIQFLGSSRTLIERIQTTPGMASSQSAFQNFLKLTQPISESSYPQPRILEAGRTYEFQFLFVVPQQLLPRMCRHVVQHESVRDLHLQVPPTLGDRGNRDGRGDDISPTMASISYQIVAQIQDDGKRLIAVKSRAVDILPNFDEQPPVNIDGPDSDYRMRKEKSIKKGLFKGRLGSLVVEADQPKSFRLPSDYAESLSPVNTVAKIRLRFDPVDGNSSPPKLSSLSSRLKVSTWYSDSARPIVPNKKCIQYDVHQGLHTEMSSKLSRRDSALSNFSSSDKTIPAPSEQYAGDGFYTAEILVPITLPSKKYFVPTFHSCLTSRTYALHLALSVQGGAITAPCVELKLPIQVSSVGGSAAETPSPRNSLTPAEQVEEARIADEFFVPRTISPMEESLVGNSNLLRSGSVLPSDLPPQYEMFSQIAQGVRVAG
ncbi:hypothetical protein BDV97DRAFT_201383 [Delphinella strobiligena]|nr:hypothetical protein BDV97DRAFT_201383 [Delphinella strobiligena]